MKRVLSALLVAILLVMLTGCTETAYSEDDFVYNFNTPQIQFWIPESAEELVGEADCVYEGVVTDISFVAGYQGHIFCLSTVYTVLVTDEYKGNAGMIEYVISEGGIYNYKVAEQVQAWRDAGREDPAVINLPKYVPVLEIGETYIFFVGEQLSDAPYKGYRLAGHPSQFATPTNDNSDDNDNDKIDRRWPGIVIPKEEVYEYFGVNPVVRTVLRIGLCVVIVASVTVVTVLIIRKKKKKPAPECPEDDTPE